jgi:Secretion system C-terminal sorting domain
MNLFIKPLALCAFLVANVLQVTAQCTVIAPQTTSRILYTSPVFIPPTWVNPSARLPSGTPVYATGTYVDRIKSRLNPLCDSLVYTVSVVADASCRVPDSLRVVKIHQLVTARGAVTGWNLLTPYSTWNGVVMNAAGCVDSVKIQRDTIVCVQRGGNHTVTLHVLPSLPGAEYAWYRRGQLVALTTDRILTINNIQPSDTGSYSVAMTVPGFPVGVINGVQVKFCCVPSTSHTYITIRQDSSILWCGQNRTTSGNYTCTLQNSSGCDSFAILHLSVLPCNLRATLSRFGDRANALPQNGVRPYTYRWSTGNTNNYEIINSRRSYRVTVTDSIGCYMILDSIFEPLATRYSMNPATIPCNSNVGSGCTPIVLVNAANNVTGYAIRLKFDPTKVKPDSIQYHTKGSIIPNGARFDQYVIGDELIIIISLTTNQNINGVAGNNLICVSWSAVSNMVPVNPISDIYGTIEEDAAAIGLTTHSLRATSRIVSASSILLWNLYQGNSLMLHSTAANPTIIKSGIPNNMLTRGIFGAGGNFLLSPLMDNYLQIKRNSNAVVGIPVIGGQDAYETTLVMAGHSLATTNVYKLISMDTDGNGAITPNDLTNINRRSVNAQPGFRQSNLRGDTISWRHFPKSWVTTKPAFRLSATFPADDGVGISRNRVPMIDSIFQPDAAYLQRCDTTSMDIASILLGDADGNYNLFGSPILGKLSTRITIDGRNATRNADTFRIPVYGDDRMTGLDFKIENYTSNLEIVSVTKANPNVEVVANIDNITKNCYISAYSTEPTGLVANAPLIYITVKTNCPFSNRFGIVKSYLNGQQSGTDITSDPCTPTNETKELFENNIQIFPNPTSGLITVQHENLTPKTIQVFNILGRLISEVQAGNGSTMVDLSDFAKGVYLIKVDNYTQRVVKQ